MTLSMAAIMIVDFYIVRRGEYDASRTRVENWNWAGLITMVLAAATGIALMVTGVFSIGFIVSPLVVLIVYPILRKLLPEGTGTSYADAGDVFEEAR